MKNAYYIDEAKRNRTLTTLSRIHGIALQARHIESVLEEEIQETRKILDRIKDKKDAA